MDKMNLTEEVNNLYTNNVEEMKNLFENKVEGLCDNIITNIKEYSISECKKFLKDILHLEYYIETKLGLIGSECIALYMEQNVKLMIYEAGVDFQLEYGPELYAWVCEIHNLNPDDTFDVYEIEDIIHESFGEADKLEDLLIGAGVIMNTKNTSLIKSMIFIS